MTKTNEFGEEILHTHTHTYKPTEKSDLYRRQIFRCECGKETCFLKNNKWVEAAKFNAKCPKCEALLGANGLNDLLAGAYDHFVDAHVVGGSFD